MRHYLFATGQMSSPAKAQFRSSIREPFTLLADRS
jgi:hypothetical protein